MFCLVFFWYKLGKNKLNELHLIIFWLHNPLDSIHFEQV